MAWSSAAVALTRKDLIVVRAHRRKACGEWLFPSLLGVLCGVVLVTAVGWLSDGNKHTWEAADDVTPSTDRPCGGYDMALASTNSTSTSNASAALRRVCPGPRSFSAHRTVAAMDEALLHERHWFWKGVGVVANDDATWTVEADGFGDGGIMTLAALMLRANIDAGVDGLPSNYAAATQQRHIGDFIISVNVHVYTAAFAGILMCLSLGPFLTATAGRLVDEKVTGVREHLRVTGLSASAYIASAAFLALLRVAVSAVVLIGMVGIFAAASAKEENPLRRDGSVAIPSLFLMQIVYGAALTGVARLMPAFFSRATACSAVCYVTTTGAAVGAPFATALPPAAQWALALVFPPIAHVMAVAQVASGGGTVLPVGPWAAQGILLLQCVVFTALGEYLSAVYPGPTGAPLPALFPIHAIRRALATASSSTSESATQLLDSAATATTTSAAPPPPPQHQLMVRLRRLTVTYGTRCDAPAVDGLDLSVRRGEILALLGHNGAGKSTAIKALCGLVDVDGYDAATVAGCLDLRSQLPEIRAQLAVCPQHDVLFDELTARQHLAFFGAIRGRSTVGADETLEARIDRLMAALQLPEATRAGDMSGGNRRRLSVACALVGSAPLVFLDEPSSGLDPVSRRNLWRVINDERRERGKTVVLTTHFMEEADYLGDRIAIMSHGRLVCCDTSAALKLTYGLGYRITVVRSDANQRDDDDDAALIALATEHVPTATIRESGPNGITLTIPNAADVEEEVTEQKADAAVAVAASHGGGMCALLAALDALIRRQPPQHDDARHSGDGDERRRGPWASYGVSLASLEDVFLSIAAGHGTMSPPDGAVGDDTPTADMARVLHKAQHDDAASTPAALRSARRFTEDVGTVLWLKWTTLLRTPRLIVLGVLVPLIFLAVGFATIFPAPVGGFGPAATRFPDMQRQTVPVFLMEPASLSTTKRAALGRFLDGLNRVYGGWRKHAGARGGELDFIVVDNAYNQATGAFVPMETASFLWHHNYPYILLLRGGGDIDFDRGRVDFAIWFDGWDYSKFLNFDMTALIHATIFSATEPRDPVTSQVRFNLTHPFVPRLSGRQLDLTSVVSSPPSPSPPSHKKDGRREHVYIILGILTVFGIGQLAGNAAVNTAELLSRGTYDWLRITGLKASAFWVGTFVFDFAALAMPYVIGFVIGTYARNDDVTWQLRMVLSFTVVCMMAFIGHVLVVAYAILAYLPRTLKPSTYVVAVASYVAVTLSTPFVLQLLWVIAQPADKREAALEDTEWVYYLFPSRAFMMSVISLPGTADVWTASPDAKRAMVSVCLWSLVPVGALVWFVHGDAFRRWRSSPATPTAVEDREPVGDELHPSHAAQHVQHALAAPVASGACIVARGLTVEYPGGSDADSDTEGTGDHRQGQRRCRCCCAGRRKPTVALDGFNLVARRGECTTLLGPNGAGKTSALRTLLHLQTPTRGDVRFAATTTTAANDTIDDGQFATDDALYARHRIGVCPQFDAVPESLTGVECVELALRCRFGSIALRRHGHAAYVDSALAAVGLEPVSGSKLVRELSGGSRRKVSVACAVFSGSNAVILDEPSTGMDPSARRSLWRAIAHATASSEAAVLLTTHSMDEAEAVSAEVGILVQGTLRCFGKPRALQHKYGGGYIVSVTPASRDVSVRRIAELLAEAMGVSMASLDVQHVDTRRDGSTAAAASNETPVAEKRFVIRAAESAVTPGTLFTALTQLRADGVLVAVGMTEAAGLDEAFMAVVAAAA